MLTEQPAVPTWNMAKGIQFDREKININKDSRAPSTLYKQATERVPFMKQ